MTGIFEDRLINFANLILHLGDQIKMTESGKHLKSQLIRSGTSPALNYGEAQSAESNRDLLHKFRIIVKELRETYINLKLIKMNDLCKDLSILEQALDENNQLIAIFIKSIQTVRKKTNNK
ncbi:MAG: four helix bundle protein [Bacteroidales bacterium]|nr:four helix bundle protein [Bacteroidales bacterium]